MLDVSKNKSVRGAGGLGVGEERCGGEAGRRGCVENVENVKGG
jgi:hypothetical protein